MCTPSLKSMEMESSKELKRTEEEEIWAHDGEGC